MISTLQEKLKQFGLVPDRYYYDNVAQFSWFQIMHNEFDKFEFQKYGMDFLHKELKTDADWQAVAGFLRFLRGSK